MIDNEDKITADSTTTTITNNECDEKITRLNKKLQDTVNELIEITKLYEKSKKDLENKINKIKELEARIKELEAQLEKCNKEKEQLKEELKKCQTSDENSLQEKLKKCQADNEKEKEIIEQLKDDLIKYNNKKEELKAKLKQCQAEKEQLAKDLKKCREKKKKDPCDGGLLTNVLVKIPEIKAGIYAVTGADDEIYCVGRHKSVFKVKNNKEVVTVGYMDAHARTIKYDGAENIFIGTNGGTIYKYDIDEEEFTEIKKVKGTITTIEADDNCNVYIGTWESENKNLPGSGTVYKIKAGTTDLIEIKGITASVWSLAIDKNDNIYAGTNRGLFQSSDQVTFNKSTTNIPYQNHNMHSIRAILIDKNEDIWIGTREAQYIGNVYKRKIGEENFTRIPKTKAGEIFTIATDNKENIYAGSWTNYGAGNLFKYNNKTNNFELAVNIPTNLGSLESIFIDENNDIYFGTRIGSSGYSNEGSLYKMREVCM